MKILRDDVSSWEPPDLVKDPVSPGSRGLESSPIILSPTTEWTLTFPRNRPLAQRMRKRRIANDAATVV